MTFEYKFTKKFKIYKKLLIFTLYKIRKFLFLKKKIGDVGPPTWSTVSVPDVGDKHSSPDKLAAHHTVPAPAFLEVSA